MALGGYLKNIIIFKEYNDVNDTFHWSRVFRKIFGSFVEEVYITPENRTKIFLSKFGFVTFIFWNSLYIYCAYVMQTEDQTILRNLYQTKLNRYGDDFERISTTLYVLMTMFLIPFRLSSNNGIVQKLTNLDVMIKNAGGQLDYTKLAVRAFFVSVFQICVYVLRMACIWVPIKGSSHEIPTEKIFQVVYSDAQAIIMISIFCVIMIIVRDRFNWINNVLTEIKDRNYWEYKLYSRGKTTPNVVKVAQIQEKHILEKLKTCSLAYGSLFQICENINCVFGFSLLLTLLQYFNLIVLYLFYFMEATAASLFQDVKAYVDFLVYDFWEIVISLGLMFTIVYFCESVMGKARQTAYVVHEIINGDFSTAINTEAMQFSVQLLHEKPVFKVLGLFKLNYALLQQGARSVSTYLVILLQFVTENSHNI